ncbi:MAG: DinB family protein [Nocardioides sp.]
MTDTDPVPGSDELPWEPPFSGTEAEHLTGALDRLRTTFRWKADGLDAAGLGVTLGASTLSIGGLLKHLAFVEDYTFTTKFRDRSPGEAWADFDVEDWDFVSAADDSPERLYARYDEAVARARAELGAALADGGLDQPIAMTGPAGEPVSLRRLVFDLVEEYGRHTGHADLLREAVDGRVGEDPPPGWLPESGSYTFS